MVNYEDIPPSDIERMLFMENREFDREAMAKMSPKERDRALGQMFFQVPYDARFPHTHQTRRCKTYYTDYYRCIELLGVDYKPCEFFKSLYKAVCSPDEIKKFDEARKQGCFTERFDR
ncbi:unnamed protein product [Enterobius vermicularis]|uniref:CHCH domain-containing protein n=1 Tax=Enterobius vermicularis TaxID=51028 RepID=A0A0N4VI32_ENTVE|nr:unnamed protein product [Enterobius vermicularis]